MVGVPTPTAPLRALLAAGLTAVVTTSVLLLPGAPVAVLAPAQAAETPAPTATATPAPTPTCQPQPLCGVNPGPTGEPTPTAEPTLEPTPTATATASRSATASPTPRRTRSRSAAPVRQDDVPAADDGGSLADPVTGGGALGTLGPASGSTLATPATDEVAADDRGGDGLGRLVFLVLGVGVFLGLAGGTGLYMTRHGHEH